MLGNMTSQGDGAELRGHLTGVGRGEGEESILQCHCGETSEVLWGTREG